MKGNVTIPKVDGATTAYWISESEATTQSNSTLGQLALSPKTVSGNVAISRNLAMQSDPSAEALFSNDLATTLALAIDLAAINGSGVAGQPTGILNTTGIGTQTTATVTWAQMLGFEEDVAVANADDGALAFLTTPAVRRTLKATDKATGAAQFIWQKGFIDEYMGTVSNQVPAQHILFGNFAQLMIAEWGTIELQVITQGTNHRAGEIELDAFQSIDLGVRQPGAFSVSTDFAA
jgi:HK97 family phage major capsid protein